MLALVPIGVVNVPKSELIFIPLKVHEITSGSSPFLTMHDAWANAPSSSTSLPKDMGSKSGGTALLDDSLSPGRSLVGARVPRHRGWWHYMTNICICYLTILSNKQYTETLIRPFTRRQIENNTSIVALHHRLQNPKWPPGPQNDRLSVTRIYSNVRIFEY